MWEVRKLRIEAEERYRSTGDSHAIVELRARAMHRFGFALGREARNDVERGLFLGARDLLAQLEAEVPEVPWSADWKERFSVLKGWAEAGGQPVVEFGRYGIAAVEQLSGARPRA